MVYRAGLDPRPSDGDRNCGRYSTSGHEPNTYLLFTEAEADMLRHDGRAGIYVKSALALDKSATAVFQKLVGREQVSEIHDFVNGGPTGTNLIFPAVDA